MRMQGWGVKTIAGVGMFAGWFLACSGDDIPPVDNDLRGALASSFGGSSMETGSAGSDGSGMGGSGGSGGSGTSGSANAGGGAAGDGAEPVGGGSGGGCDAFNTIIAERCGSSGCHNAGSPQGAFAVSEEGVVDFVDKPSTKGAGACDQVFIDSSNPEDSLLYTRLFSADCGGILSMPLTGDQLTEAESDCMLSWLQQFAE
jgi:hypothetical protein